MSHIVIFIDGFDTVINKYSDVAVSRFLQLNLSHGILVAVEEEENHHPMFPCPLYTRMRGSIFFEL